MRPRPAPLLWTRAFPGIPEQVRAARQFVSGLLQDSPLRDDAVAVVSELFTNAIVHTHSRGPGGLVTVQVSRWWPGVRIAVTDQGSQRSPVIYPPADCGRCPEGGNGLFIVSQLTSRLGWHDDACGRTVCAILGKLPPGQPPTAGLDIPTWAPGA